MQRKGNIFRAALVCIAICLAMLAWPTIYFHSTPLPAFDRALTVYSGQVPVVLGGRDGFSEGESYHRRNYILFPSFFRNPKFVRVTQTGDGQPKVTETNATFELFLLLAIIVFSLSSYIRRKQSTQ
jgi:hypothetical protein